MIESYPNNVSVKIPFTDSTGTSFVDYALTPKTFLAYGNTVASSLTSKWGGNSGYFDGTGDGLYCINATDWNMAAGDWCFEGWVKPHASSTNHQCIISNIRNEGNSSPGGAGGHFAGNGGWGGPGDEANGVWSGVPGSSGTLGQGGAGSAAGDLRSSGGGGGGGGGGGYWGGGGGCGSGGWWGGGGAGSGGGGSNFVSSTLSSIFKYKGNETFLSPTAVSETGHSGNGYCSITDLTTSIKYNFAFTGAVQTFTTSSNGSYLIQVWGAQGSNATLNGTTLGGNGGHCSGVITLTSGTVLYVQVGGQAGYNGGGAGGASGSETGKPGGGATDVRLTNNTLTDRIIVAGGGGGASGVGSNGYGGTKSNVVGGGAEMNGNHGGSPDGFGIFVDNTAKTFWAVIKFTDGSLFTIKDMAEPMDTTIFNHFALSRQGSIIRLFRNGIKTSEINVGTRTFSISTGNYLFLGCYRDDLGSKVYGLRGSLYGYLNDVRVTKGVARYTTDFVPPFNFLSNFIIDGYVYDELGLAAIKTLRVYNRATGVLVAEEESDVTGFFEFVLGEDIEYNVLALDDTNLYNHKLARTLTKIV